LCFDFADYHAKIQIFPELGGFFRSFHAETVLREQVTPPSRSVTRGPDANPPAAEGVNIRDRRGYGPKVGHKRLLPQIL
jgi:hypothetical protein